jgi:chlorite dismutase
VHIWRRSFATAPPNGESLKDTAERTLPFFERAVLGDIAQGKDVLVVAHGNSNRAIVMELDQLDPLRSDEVPGLELATGVPLASTTSTPTAPCRASASSTTTPEQYRDQMAEKGVTGDDLERRVAEFAERMETYTRDKLYPQMPEWELACFYPMSHRREGDDNWYSLDFDERRRLMGEHGRSGRAYTGRVLQLVSGSTGLDEWEWGVTLFTHDIADIKDIVYTMRYDEASARFAEFGDFVIGMRRTPEDLVAELGLEAGGHS